MARRKTNDLENQMSLMDMMASESPEYTEEGPEELLDPGEDMGDSEGQTDKPFKLVANKTTKAKVSISTQALNVVKAVYPPVSVSTCRQGSSTPTTLMTHLHIIWTYTRTCSI